MPFGNEFKSKLNLDKLCEYLLTDWNQDTLNFERFGKTTEIQAQDVELAIYEELNILKTKILDVEWDKSREL